MCQFNQKNNIESELIYLQDNAGVLLGQKFVTPIKVGFLAVTIAYFLFTLHATFTLSWIGEWEGLSEPLYTWIFLTDTVAYIFLIFRFLASIIALATVILYIAKKVLPKLKLYRLLQLILIFEGIYWIGLLLSGIWGIIPTDSGFSLLISTGIPCTFSSIAIPTALFMLAVKLKPDKPQKQAIRWGLFAGIFYVFAFWLSNSGMWIITVLDKGWSLFSQYPELIPSFAATLFGLLGLAMFLIYFAKTSWQIERIQDLKVGTVGAVLVALGLYYLWNYMTWIFFGGWTEWYAWFLGHNLDLWLLALPILGLPLLFYKQKSEENSN